MRNVFLKAENQREFKTKGYSTMPMLSSQEVNLVLSELQLMKPDNNFNAESSSEQPSYHLTDFDSNIQYKIKAKQLITSILEPRLKNIFDNYKIITTNFIIKPPGKGKFPVHQDWTFVLDRKNYTSLTLWCPLVDTNEDNGTLQVVEGSHEIVPDIVTSTVDFYCKNFEDAIVEKYGKVICLKAGECLVFDHSLLHFSDENHTDQPRYVMQAILVPSEIDPVFYYFDVNEPKKGFEVFQTEPDFFVFQDFFKRPSNLKSLGFIENQNRLLTEEEFIEKMQKRSQSGKAGSSSLISVKPSSINQELEDKGYTVIDFLEEDEVQSLIRFYRENSIPNDIIEPFVSATICSSDLAYRQQVIQQAKKVFIPKLEILFPNHKVAICTFINKKPNKLSSGVTLHQDRSFADEINLKTFGVWCPLIDVNEENGCFNVVQKSHLLNSTPRSSNSFAHSQEVLSIMKQDYLTNIPMKAGQALVYDNRLFHGSCPNSTNAERVALICVITPKNSPVLFYSRYSQNSNKLEVFEVDDTFYDSYIQGEKPENALSLGIFDYQVAPITPEQFVEFMNAPERKADKDTGIREKFLSFFNLLRGNDWWFYKIPPLLAIAYAEILLQATPTLQSIITLLSLIASMFFVAAYGHVVNDIFDIEVDLQAGKYNRIACLSNLQRILLSASLAVAGLIPWFFIGINTKSTFLLATIYVLLTIYSAPPLRLKERGIWGVITDAAQVHAVPTLLVATVFSDLASIPQPESATLATVATAWAFLVGIRAIVLHQIWDWKNDLNSGVKTLVTSIGVDSARFGISYIVFPSEIFLLCLLMWVTSHFAPLVLVFFIPYILLRMINIKLTSGVFDTAPVQKAYILPHDFYEVWLPLALTILLSVREVSFLSLLGLHIVLFYPAIAQRATEFNLPFISCSKLIAKLVKLLRNDLNRQETIQQERQEMLEIPTTLPSDKFQDSITKAIDFLTQVQLEDGEFQTTLPNENLKAICGTLGLKQKVTEKLVFDSSPFVTSLVIYSLSFLSYESKVQQLIARGLSFLSKEMESSGLWRYWSSKNEKHYVAPPDLDDICCASYVLRMNGIPIQPNTAIILGNRNRQGLFYTWLLPRYVRGIILDLVTLGKRFSCLDEFWQLTNKDDICCVVNANVLLYLGENIQTQKAVEYLTSVVLQGSEDDNTSFYNHKLSFYYMLSRAYFNGVNSLRGIIAPVTNKIFSLQKADGSFGDELLTALAVCTLLNFNCQTLSLDKAIDFLLKTQQSDGSWQRIPMYGGKTDKKTFGSAELTTAFCIESLSRYRLLDRVGNWQQSRAELQQVQEEFKQSQSQLYTTQTELAQSQSELHASKTEFVKSQSDLQYTQNQLQQTQTELTQSESELQTSQTELALLKSYLHQTQGSEGIMSYYRSRIASNPDDIQVYHQALIIKPDDAQISLQLGNAFVRQNRFCEAIATYQTALQFHPNNFEIHLELAKALEKEQKWEDAIASYQRAIELNPDYSWSHKHLGDILAEQGQLNDASTSYRRALQLQPRIF
ncbi:tetratricopeptide repeat protein [Nostoc sp. C052]|uniref:phytanoyl-CoA dioxygenase family protein n=1 Tax=Nostoc sp. C052 TaxID=2576902 RepID=UPI0015C3F84A|nr:phytanoyl-CoA dioxygenase family protein [Nostoc sp. C052]QLE44447.1 tetratricopeptide repeat protein [Nostoc sp. C052]